MSARHDEHRVDWRSRRPAMAVRRQPAKLRGRIATAVCRIAEAIRAIPNGEPSNWRDAAVFLVGSAWGVTLTVGAFEAWRHLS